MAVNKKASKEKISDNFDIDVNDLLDVLSIWENGNWLGRYLKCKGNYFNGLCVTFQHLRGISSDDFYDFLIRNYPEYFGRSEDGNIINGYFHPDNKESRIKCLKEMIEIERR